MSDSRIAEVLDRLVAPFDSEPEQWQDVVARATAQERPTIPALLRPERPRVGATRFKSRWAFRASLAASVAAAAVAALLLAPSGGPGVLDRALAALPANGPVVHVVSVSTCCDGRGDGVMSIATGAVRPMVSSTETWLDPEEKVAHAVGYLEGRVSGDMWRTPTEMVDSVHGRNFEGFSGALDSGVVLFAHYRELLESGDAHVLSHGTFAGREVDWVEFAYPATWESGKAGTSYGGLRADVAVDSETGKPLGATYPDSPGVADRFTTVEYVQRDAANLSKPALPTLPEPPSKAGYPMAKSRRAIAPEAASSVLGRPAPTPGAAVGDLQLAGAYAVDFGRGEAREGVELLYGATDGNRPGWTGRYVLVSESVTVEALSHMEVPAGYLTGDQILLLRDEPTSDAAPTAPLGGVRWTGTLKRHGLFVSIQAPTKELVLEAARALAPAGSS
jgi:hypothetical protein